MRSPANRGPETAYTTQRTLGSGRVGWVGRWNEGAIADLTVVEQVMDRVTGRVGVSRALPVALKDRLLSNRGATELPVLRGVTIVPDDWVGTVVVGHPNYFGRFEPVCDCDHEIRLTGAWAALRSMPGGSVAIRTAEQLPTTIAEGRLADARLVARRLGQLPGVQTALRIQSPIIVVVTPGTDQAVETALPGVTVLGRDFPEYPGGVRIELPGDVGDFDGVRYAGALEELLRRKA